MSDPGLEVEKRDKTLVSPDEYAGLQLDTEPRLRDADGLEKVGQDLVSPTSTAVHPWNTPQEPFSDLDQNSRYGPWGRRRNLVFLGVVIGLIALAAILGGVLGSRAAAASAFAAAAAASSSSSSSTAQPSASSSTSTTATPVTSQSATPSDINAGLPGMDIMVASPLAPLAFTQGGEQWSLIFQSADGQTRFANKNGSAGSWSPAQSVFTDAVNGTGFAATSFPSKASVNSSVVYIDTNSQVCEKRVNGSGYWDWYPQIYNLKIQVSGNSSTDGVGGWNGYRMTSAYSANFSSGPGTRLFVHQGNGAAAWVQEFIWTQSNDSWAYGGTITNGVIAPGAHMVAVVEPRSQCLRLFYSTIENGVAELWINITDPAAQQWQFGVSLPGILTGPSADFSVVTMPNETLLYYSDYTDNSSSTPSAVAIHEISLPPLPSVPKSPSALPPPAPVANPSLQAFDNDGAASLFVPIGAVASPDETSVTVFYPEQPVDPRSGYGALKSITRGISDGWSKGVSQSIQLGVAGV